MSEARKVLLCGGGSQCCPEATFLADGSVELRGDDGQVVVLTAFQVSKLHAEAARRGLVVEEG